MTPYYTTCKILSSKKTFFHFINALRFMSAWLDCMVYLRLSGSGLKFSLTTSLARRTHYANNKYQP